MANVCIPFSGKEDHHALMIHHRMVGGSCGAIDAVRHVLEVATADRDGLVVGLAAFAAHNEATRRAHALATR